MKLIGIEQGTARFFGSLLLLGGGLVGLDVLAGLAWADVTPFDLRPLLVGLSVLAAAAGILSVTSLRMGPRFPRWHRWIFGLGTGVLVPFKLGLTHPASLATAFALIALVVVGITWTLDDGRAPRVLAGTCLLLFVLSRGWFDGLAGSVLGEMTLSVLAGLVLGVLLAVLYRLPGAVTRFVDRRAWLVSGVLMGLFLAGMFAWWTIKPREQVPSYFSGTVPEVQKPGGASLRDMPNIILISVDTLRADRVPPLADEELHVPNLRKLMDDSVRFTDVFSSSSWTLPSHASLFTGLPPMAHGAVNPEGSRLYGSVPSYVQMLRKLGYQTAAFTDGGFMSEMFGFGRGFEYFQTDYPSGESGGSLRPEAQEWGKKLLDRFNPSPRSHPPGTKPEQYHYFWKNLRAARSWMSTERDPARPFFLFLHTYQAHDYLYQYPRSMRRLQERHPRMARVLRRMKNEGSRFRSLDDEERQRLYERFALLDERAPVRSSFLALAKVYPSVWNVLQSWVLGLNDAEWEAFVDLSVEGQKKVLFRASVGARRWGVPPLPNLRTDYSRTSYTEWLQSTFKLEEEILRRIRERNHLRLKALEWLYDDLVEDVDRSLGDFLDHLRSRNLYENTVIVYLSDHGEGFSWSPLLVDHGFRTFLDGRGQLNDELTQVPVWVKPPENLPSGMACEELYQLRDVFPIVFRQLGIQVNHRTSSGKLGPPDEGANYCPPSRRTFAKGSVTQREPWLDFQPRFYVRGEEYRLEAQRDPWAEFFWKVHGQQPDQPVPPEAVPEKTRERLHLEMERYLRRFDEHPDPYRKRNWEAAEELEAELRGLGYF